MKLIDAEMLKKAWRKKHNIGEDDLGAVFVGYTEIPRLIDEQQTIVEFEGDINKVIVKGEEYHKQLTTTWLGSYCPYRCEHCGRHVDSKERYCPSCGRRATNYD